MAVAHSTEIVTSIFLIFCGAAVLSTVALFARQSMLVAYMVAGILLGPYGFDCVGNVDLMKHTGDIGIIFLLFLLGLHLPPQKLIGMLRKISIVGIVSSFAFCFVSFFDMPSIWIFIERLINYWLGYDVFQYDNWHKALTHHDPSSSAHG